MISTWLADMAQAGIGKARPREYQVTCKDGSRKTIHFRPVTMGNGDQLIIHEDLTRQKRAEKIWRKTNSVSRVS